jgi:hypothetical protein
MLILLSLSLAASPDETAPQDAQPVQPVAAEPDTGLKFLGLVQSRLTTTNEVTTSLTSDGQVVGLLGGLNQTDVSDVDRATVGEFRTDGFFTYAPPVLDGHASLTAAFEVDYNWGDQAYQIGGNTGGGFGGDQVNLQTRRLHASFRPSLSNGHSLAVHVGLQFVPDGVYDPTTSKLDDLARAGGGLRFFGSEAAGISAYGRWRSDWGDRVRYRLGAFTLYEKGVSLPDDATLYLGDVQYQPFYATRVGAHLWYLRDRTGGSAGIAGTGPTSFLSELQGGPSLDLRAPGEDTAPAVNADVYWLGVDGGYNHRLDKGPFGISGSVFGNLGSLLVVDANDVHIQGLSAEAEARWRYLPGEGSVLRLEGIYSSADGTGRDAYTGVLTGNSWGIVGALWTTHGSYLLFPDGKAINRQVSMVYDISNQGDGLVAASASVGWDPIPNRLNLTAGLAHANSARMEPVGTEVNLKVAARPLLFCEMGVVAAAVTGSKWETSPWMSYGYLEWITF